MHEIDYLDIDGRLLTTMVAVYEEQSVTKAGARLGISQSTLSHRLERLRAIIGDPIFVRAGRGISPTTRADQLIVQAKAIVDMLQAMTEAGEFDLSELDNRFVVAATDYERSLFLLEAYKSMLRRAPRLRLDFVWERYDNSDALRKGQFDVAISPIESSDEQDLRKRHLFSDKFLCFYDPRMIGPPVNLPKYLDSRHVRIIFSESDSSYVDNALSAINVERSVAINLPSLSELPKLLKGSNLVATVPSRLKASLLSEFAFCEPPFEISPLRYSLFWHERTHISPKHLWLRKQIVDFVQTHL